MYRENIWVLCGFWFFIFVSYLILPDSTCAPLSETACRLPTISMTCPHGRKKELYYYDWKKKACATFSYKGCGGNENRFAVKNECEAKCGQYSKSQVNGKSTKKPAIIIKKPNVKKVAKKDETENSKDYNNKG